MAESPTPGQAHAHLEYIPEQGGPAELVPITKNSYIIGRSRSADFPIYSQKISKQHAMISREGGGFRIGDLESTNGTFVNGKRVDDARLQDGDIIHIAGWEFCFRLNARMENVHCNTTRMTQATHVHAQESRILANTFLNQMIADESVGIVFQPIVDLRTHAIIGYEALGRGNHHRLSQSPVKLFELAEKCQKASELCRLFRGQAIKDGDALPADLRLFLNIHPAELARDDYRDSLVDLARNNRLCRQLVIEVSEHLVTNVPQMRRFQENLAELGFEFAYDDFGAGQARLLELAECQPHFLKLDRSLVQGIERSATRQGLIRAILSANLDMDIQVIAEGIETEPEAMTCLELGCHLGQGFFFKRPTSIVEIVGGLGMPAVTPPRGAISIAHPPG